jgi:hypothetical protein
LSSGWLTAEFLLALVSTVSSVLRDSSRILENCLCRSLEIRLIWISHETHYVSATEPNRSMLFIVRTIRNT